LERALAARRVVGAEHRDPADRARDEDEQGQPVLEPKILDRVAADAVHEEERQVAVEHLPLGGASILDAERRG
jgi:hypothetical protein